jgi:iron complex transport system ATP-binding protein
MRDGDLIATGTPESVITPELLMDVFDLDATVIEDPVVGGPLIVPNDPHGLRNRS